MENWRDKSSLRILIINYEYPPIGGGASHASSAIARELVNEGHQVTVLTSAFGDWRGERVEDGVVIHRVACFRREQDRSNLLQMFFFAVAGLAHGPRLVRSVGFDHALSFFTIPSGIVARWLHLFHGLNYVISLRGGDVPGLVPELARIHRLLRGVRRSILRGANAIVANSQTLADLSRQSDRFPVEVIPNGVDHEKFCGLEQSRVESDGVLRVLFVGRLQPQKNLSQLIQALAEIELSGKTKTRLVVAGDGPLRGVLELQAERLGVAHRIEWLGWVETAELLRCYQDTDCLVSPSRFEGLPNTVLEAMSCGVPVALSRIPAHEEIVSCTENGILFGLDDIDDLVKTLLLIAGDRAVANRMGLAGQQYVQRSFSWAKTAQEYVRLLEVHD